MWGNPVPKKPWKPHSLCKLCCWRGQSPHCTSPPHCDATPQTTCLCPHLLVKPSRTGYSSRHFGVSRNDLLWIPVSEIWSLVEEIEAPICNPWWEEMLGIRPCAVDPPGSKGVFCGCPRGFKSIRKLELCVEAEAHLSPFLPLLGTHMPVFWPPHSWPLLFLLHSCPAAFVHKANLRDECSSACVVFEGKRACMQQAACCFPFPPPRRMQAWASKSP
jgi:hypothetical protein